MISRSVACRRLRVGAYNQETGTLWSDTVSKEIFDSVDDTEKKRQEAINEVIYTERDFVRDLEYLRDVSSLGRKSARN